MLTGVTGSLGSFILRDLIQSQYIKKIYCLIRPNNGNNNDIAELTTRLKKSFHDRLLDVSLLESPKVQVLPFLLFDEPYLGWNQDTYNKLKNEVTIIQHCAWSMNVTQTVEFYERDMIRGLYNLLKFAYCEKNPIHIHFISSNSATAAWKSSSVPEIPVPNDPAVSMPMGYSYSKYIVEYLFDYLSRNKNFPCIVERLGQITGDTQNGVWDPQQPYPLMILGGSRLGMLPDLATAAVTWLPVDYAAASIIEIMLKTKATRGVKQSVFHIVNPTSVTWLQVLRACQECGIQFDIVSPAKFVEEINKHPDNLAYQVKSFFEARLKTMESDSNTLPVWETARTIQMTPVLAKAPGITADLLKKYLEYWSTLGFSIY